MPTVMDAGLRRHDDAENGQCVPAIKARRRQRGAATVLMALVLVMATVAFTLGVAHTTTLEQRMARNSVLANQAQQAAQAGLGYGGAWLKMQRPDWLTAPDGREVATATPNPPALTSGNGDSFAINLTFERRPEWEGYIFAQATASPASAPEIEAHASQFLRPTGVLTRAAETAPPLIVDGCADLTDTSDLYPEDADRGRAGIAVRASGESICVRTGRANLHGGGLHGGAFEAGVLWDHVMTVSRDEFRELAEEQSAQYLPANQRDYWWASPADLYAGEWRMSLGSAQRPIVLVIPAELGCPRFAGGAQIIGLVLIEADCTGAPAWGEARIYGSLAVAGLFDSLGPGSRLAHISQAPGSGPASIETPPLEIIQLAGSWRDF